jgi:hypothetical protein
MSYNIFNMKLLSKKEVERLFTRQGYFGGKSGPFLNKALEAKVDESVLLLRQEWPLKADPGSLLSLSCRYNKNCPLFGRRFSLRTLPDKSGWVFTRTA